MSSNTEIREKGECAAVRAVGQGLCPCPSSRPSFPRALLLTSIFKYQERLKRKLYRIVSSQIKYQVKPTTQTY
eukprot:scaffold520_cov271-Chaetoceros_neogracile.AAC.22